jgi:hypothetical protein
MRPGYVRKGKPNIDAPVHKTQLCEVDSELFVRREYQPGRIPVEIRLVELGSHVIGLVV